MFKIAVLWNETNFGHVDKNNIFPGTFPPVFWENLEVNESCNFIFLKVVTATGVSSFVGRELENIVFHKFFMFRFEMCLREKSTWSVFVDVEMYYSSDHVGNDACI